MSNKAVIDLSSLSVDEVKSMVTEHGGYRGAATHLVNNYSEIWHRGKSRTRTHGAIERIVRNICVLHIAGREEPENQSYTEELFKNSNIPLDSVSVRSATVSSWGVHAKDPETGEIITKHLYATKMNLVPEAPLWPLAEKAQGRPILYANDAPRLLRKTWQAVIVSDIQAGFLKNMRTGELQPIHDPQAVSIALQITKDVCPRKLLFIGDASDWAFLSRWQQHDEFDAVNESIQVSHDILAQFVSAAGSQVDERRMICSNHGERPEKFLLEHNRMAMKIRRASDTSKWPVFSEPYLLRYEDLGIEMSGRYPGEDYYLLRKLVLLHAPPKAKEFEASVIHGHTHHCRATPRVAHSRESRQEYVTYDIGCLTSVGQNADRLSLMVTRTPSNRGRTDWNQGLAVVNVVEGKEDIFTVDLIRIQDQHAMYGGSFYEAS